MLYYLRDQCVGPRGHCTTGHRHGTVSGKRAANATIYQEKLCHAILKGIIRQHEKDDDESDESAARAEQKGAFKLKSIEARDGFRVRRNNESHTEKPDTWCRTHPDAATNTHKHPKINKTEGTRNRGDHGKSKGVQKTGLCLIAGRRVRIIVISTRPLSRTNSGSMIPQQNQIRQTINEESDSDAPLCREQNLKPSYATAEEEEIQIFIHTDGKQKLINVLSMHVDEEEEKPPSTEPEITLEETKDQLKRCGPKYADEHAKRVFEDKITGKHTIEDLKANLAEATRMHKEVTGQLENVLKQQDGQTNILNIEIMPDLKESILELRKESETRMKKESDENQQRISQSLIKRFDDIEKRHDDMSNKHETEQRGLL